MIKSPTILGNMKMNIYVNVNSLVYFCHSFICFSEYPVVSASDCNSSKLRLGMFMMAYLILTRYFLVFVYCYAGWTTNDKNSFLQLEKTLPPRFKNKPNIMKT